MAGVLRVGHGGQTEKRSSFSLVLWIEQWAQVSSDHFQADYLSFSISMRIPAYRTLY